MNYKIIHTKPLTEEEQKAADYKQDLIKRIMKLDDDNDRFFNLYSHRFKVCDVEYYWEGWNRGYEIGFYPKWDNPELTTPELEQLFRDMQKVVKNKAFL